MKQDVKNESHPVTTQIEKTNIYFISQTKPGTCYIHSRLLLTTSPPHDDPPRAHISFKNPKNQDQLSRRDRVCIHCGIHARSIN